MPTAAEVEDFARRTGIHTIGWFAATDFDQYLATLDERDGDTARLHALREAISAIISPAPVPVVEAV